MHEVSLKLVPRTVNGKKVAGLRKSGLVPSVIYGHGEPLLTESPLVETTKAVHEAGKHTPVHLVVDGKKRLAMIKSVDIHPVRHHVRHVAFHAIKQNEIITAEVPIVLVGEGESAAERAGLVVLQAIETIEIKAKPGDLPESLELSILDLTTTDDKLTVADLKLPEGVEFADQDQDTELVIANVYEPSALAAKNDAIGGDAVDESEVEAENGEDTPQDAQGEENRPGGKDQKEPKQSNVDANK